MPGDYQFEKRAPACSKCGKQFEVGEEYHSALMMEEVQVSLDPAEAEVETPGGDGATETTSDEEKAGEAPESNDSAGPPGLPSENAVHVSMEGSLPFARADFCEGCWDAEGTGEYFSFWKAEVADEEEDRRPLAKRIDAETIFDMFRRLEGHADPAQQKFRFILALMLMRKKRLKFTGVVDSPHGEHLVLDDRDEGVTHKVLDPGLAEEEIDSLRGQIDRLLGGAEPELPDPPAPAVAGGAQ